MKNIQNASYTTYIQILEEKRDIHLTIPFSFYFIEKIFLICFFIKRKKRTPTFYKSSTQSVFMKLIDYLNLKIVPKYNGMEKNQIQRFGGQPKRRTQ